MSIEELKRLVPPPPQPGEVGTMEQWEAMEHTLGLVLPSDYRDFVFAYGSGLFARFYRVYNPFAASEYIALLPSISRVCEDEREFRRDWPDTVPYPIYPEVAGLLPWGNDQNGNDYYWLTEGPPDEWRVLTNEVRGDGYCKHDCSMTEYLVRVLRGEISPLASGYPTAEDRAFASWPSTAEA